MKILAIDDQPDNLTTLKAVVADGLPGCTVLTASNGARGLELARSEDPDVILLDIIMPEMDGFEVCRRLKADEPTGVIPVIFLTASQTNRGNRVQAVEAGAEGFLTKPLDELELVAQLRAMARLKAATLMQRDEKARLAGLVAERTQALQQSHRSMLNALEDLRAENEGRKQAEAALRQSHDAALTLMREAVEARDRSEQMSQALRASEENYRMLFREMQNGFAVHEIICDAAGNPSDYRFLAINPAFERLTGLKAAETVGRTILEIMPDTERSWIKHYGKVALTGEPVCFENYAASMKKHFEVVAFRPKIKQFACVFSDITERKQAEERFRIQAEHLVKSNEELTRFNRLMTGRELRSIELKQQVNELAAQLGQSRPYPLAFLDAAAAEVVRTTPKPNDQGAEVSDQKSEVSDQKSEVSKTQKEKSL